MDVIERRCPRCDARVTTEAEWCSACFAPIADARAGSPLAGPAVHNRVPMREEQHVASYSRWKGSPTHFGPVGRIILSVLTAIGLVIGYPMLQGLIISTVGMEVPWKGLLVIYLVAAIPGAIFLYGRIWRRVRIS